MWSNGNSFGESGGCLGSCAGNAVSGGEGGRWPVPAWKFGLRLSDDRGSI